MLLGLAAAVGAAVCVPSAPANAHDRREHQISFGRFDPELGDFTLWVAKGDGSRPRRLVEGPSYFSDWSPDGRRIAYDFADDTGVHIATISPDGRRPVQLTDEPGIQEVPRWSPDGRRIAYDASVTELDDPNFSTAIFVMDADGSDPRQLTEDGFDVEPTWAPDGRQIAFARIIGWSDEGQTNSIRIVAARGGASREVVAPTLGLEHPDWSQRGLIVFNIAPEAVVENAGAIMTVRPDGSGMRVLRGATDRYAFFKPVWATDGRSLLTGCHDRIEGLDKLCTLDADGRNLRVVVDMAPDGVNFPASGPSRS